VIVSTPNRTWRGLGQDGSDSSGFGLATLTAPSFDTSFLSSPLFLAGAGLLGVAVILSKGKKVVRRRRKSAAKRTAIKAQIAALKAGL
jgi:hypothetical protein